MKVHYQWSEDGEIELCECETVMVKEETLCYHCDLAIRAREMAVKLTASDGDIYILHPVCAEKSRIK